MPQNKNSGAWPSNPHPEEETPESPGGSIDIDDRDEGYQVSSPADDDDAVSASADDDEDTLDMEEDESEDDGGYTAAEPSPPAPSAPKKRS
jgi:hypothetical protein